MLSEHVADIFHRHIDASMRCIDATTETLAEAAERMVGCMLQEGKVFCCGDASHALLANLLASNLLNRYQYERPALPAVNLAGDATALSGITGDAAYGEVYSRQLLALGQPGDIAFICYQGAGSAAVVKAVQAAHEREMTVIALCSSEGNEANALFTNQDIEICVPHDHRARILELHVLAINCLCELIDLQLFGAEE